MREQSGNKVDSILKGEERRSKRKERERRRRPSWEDRGRERVYVFRRHGNIGKQILKAGEQFQEALPFEISYGNSF